MTLENGYNYFMNYLIAEDQRINALLGGSAEETLSSRTYRMARIKGGHWLFWEKVFNAALWFDEDKEGRRHCELSYLVEMRCGHMPKSMARAILLGAN